MRDIRIAGHGGHTRVGAALQKEALDHFLRMTTPPSAAYRDAVNWAIWRWKAIGAWSLIKGLWLHCADTSQAALLSVIGDTPRDAVIVGTAPTFTALKGYSSFEVGKQIKYPITATILASDSVFSFMAGLVDTAVEGTFIASDAGTAISIPGNFGYLNAGGVNVGVWAGGMTEPLFLRGSLIVGGARYGVGISAGGYHGTGGSIAARSSNYITRSLSPNPLSRLSAYGFLDATATTAQCRQFTAVLAAALDMLGALD